ncbi:MAG: efflux RND transporter periplasmic adaptor subunit [Rhodoferax sp.]|nr:efflux RND transporter periplasmic adaptor subunit [Rhodoferax sp.]
MAGIGHRRIWALALVAVAVVASVVWWLERVPMIEAVQVRLGPLVRTLQFAGRVATLSRVDIGSTVTARVSEVLVSEGAQVRKGTPLIRLESEELRAAVAQASAAQQQAAARLAGLRSTGRTSVQAGMAQAQAGVDAAQAEFVRVRQLVAEGFLSESRQDEVRRARDVALAQLTNARAQAQAMGESGTDVAQAQAQWVLAASATAVAQARLAQTVLVAPADARVLSREVEPGQIVQPGRALMVLALAGPTQLTAQVDERFLGQLAPGQSATAVADAYAGQRFPARVLSISPAVDPQRGVIEVKFALVGDLPAFLREDMTLSIEVETGRRDRALALPGNALVGASDGLFATVHVVHNGRIEARSVQLGLRTLDAVEVLAGLSDGDVVVLDTLRKLGSRVKVERVTLPTSAASASSKSGARGESGASALTNAMGR